MVVLLAEKEIRIFTKQIWTGGAVLHRQPGFAYSPRRGEESFEGKHRDHHGGHDCHHDYGSRGCDFRTNSGKKATCSGYQRDNDCEAPQTGRSVVEPQRQLLSRYYRCDDRGPFQRPKLHFRPQSIPSEDVS